MRITIEIEVQPEEFPAASQLISTLRTLTNHVNIKMLNGAAVPGLELNALEPEVVDNYNQQLHSDGDTDIHLSNIELQQGQSIALGDASTQQATTGGQCTSLVTAHASQPSTDTEGGILGTLSISNSLGPFTAEQLDEDLRAVVIALIGERLPNADEAVISVVKKIFLSYKEVLGEETLRPRELLLKILLDPQIVGKRRNVIKLGAPNQDTVLRSFVVKAMREVLKLSLKDFSQKQAVDRSLISPMYECLAVAVDEEVLDPKGFHPSLMHMLSQKRNKGLILPGLLTLECAAFYAPQMVEKMGEKLKQDLYNHLNGLKVDEELKDYMDYIKFLSGWEHKGKSDFVIVPVQGPATEIKRQIAEEKQRRSNGPTAPYQNPSPSPVAPETSRQAQHMLGSAPSQTTSVRTLPAPVEEHGTAWSSSISQPRLELLGTQLLSDHDITALVRLKAEGNILFGTTDGDLSMADTSGNIIKSWKTSSTVSMLEGHTQGGADYVFGTLYSKALDGCRFMLYRKSELTQTVIKDWQLTHGLHTFETKCVTGLSDPKSSHEAPGIFEVTRIFQGHTTSPIALLGSGDGCVSFFRCFDSKSDEVNCVFGGGNGGVLRWDLSAPTKMDGGNWYAPVQKMELSSVPGAKLVFDIAVSGQMLLAVTCEGIIAEFDLRNTSEVVQVIRNAAAPKPLPLWSVKVRDTPFCAAVGGSEGLLIADLSHPSNIGVYGPSVPQRSDKFQGYKDVQWDISMELLLATERGFVDVYNFSPRSPV